MTDVIRDGGQCWAHLSAGRVTRLDGVSADRIDLALDPIPPGAPVPIRYQPVWSLKLSDQVTDLLDQLEQAALSLYPEWLPGAAGIDGPHGAGIAAVRALAYAAASRSDHFGPFLADLAEAAARTKRMRRESFAPMVRAAGLARVLADAYHRPWTVLLVNVPDQLDGMQERTLVASLEWIAQHGGFGVWLTGEPLKMTDAIPAVRLDIPAYIDESTDAVPVALAADPSPPDRLMYPPLAGRPSPRSTAELALEAALSSCNWSVGRVWNQTYQPHPLARSYRLDLWWAAERCVVEVDGPEHRSPLQYADDRRRDVRLQLDGYDVLRFTNAQVLDDLPVVISQIERLIRQRRRDMENPDGPRS